LDVDNFVPDAGDFDTFLDEEQSAASQNQNGIIDSRFVHLLSIGSSEHHTFQNNKFSAVSGRLNYCAAEFLSNSLKKGRKVVEIL
jgi:hypothetical protein